MQTDHTLSPMMAPLKEKFLAGLSEKRQELCEFILHCKNDAADQKHCSVIRRRAHGLATQAKSFGFTSIVETAQTHESLLKEEGATPFMRVAECAEALLKACDTVSAAHHMEERVPE